MNYEELKKHRVTVKTAIDIFKSVYRTDELSKQDSQSMTIINLLHGIYGELKHMNDKQEGETK